MLRILILLLFSFSINVQAGDAWRFDVGGMVSGKAVVHQDIIYVTGGHTLYALDKGGNQKWSYDAKAATYASVAIADTVIFMLADNGLHALNMDGGERWLFETEDSPFALEGDTMGWGKGLFEDPWSFYRSSPIVVDGKVIFGTVNGTYALDAKTGQQLWHTETGITHTKPAHHEGTVVIGSWDNHLYGLDINDGLVKWKFTSKLPEGLMAGWKGWEGFNLDPVIADDFVYVGNRGTHFYAIKAETGEEAWSWKHATSWIGSPAIVSHDVIYFGMSDGYTLNGLAVGNGNETLLFNNGFFNFAQPAANDSLVFMASLSGELYAIDKKTNVGKTIFATEKSKENLSEMQKSTGGMKFFFSAEGGYNHGSATSEVKRMLTGLDSLLSVTLDGGMLYVGSAGGTLYAVPVK